MTSETFTPAIAELPPVDPVDLAVDFAKRDLEADRRCDVFSVGRGLINRNGVTVEGVIATVQVKLPVAQLDRACPRSYRVTMPGGEIVEVPVDVVEGPPPEILRLPIDRVSVFAANDLQRCHDCPIQGGVQIAPAGANWVGTLGSAMVAGGRFVAGTNYHVAHGGQFPAGTNIGQPSGESGAIGKLLRWCPMRFDGGLNYIDEAVIDASRTWSDGTTTNTVIPEQFGVGKINPEPWTAYSLGDRVIKVGRTTGITRGRVVQLNNQTSVDYGPEGVARFDRQLVIRADSGQFSGPGDSGSLILHEATLRPYARLFAGGGADTIANPIAFQVEWYVKTFGAGSGFFQR